MLRIYHIPTFVCITGGKSINALTHTHIHTVVVWVFGGVESDSNLLVSFFRHFGSVLTILVYVSCIESSVQNWKTQINTLGLRHTEMLAVAAAVVDVAHSGDVYRRREKYAKCLCAYVVQNLKIKWEAIARAFTFINLKRFSTTKSAHIECNSSTSIGKTTLCSTALV